ncbi:MAG: hypothetical protein RL227_827 [Pseudomonadota bacterium]
MQTLFVSPAARTAVAIAVGAGALFAAATAHAAVVSSGPVNLAVPLSVNGLYLNVLTGANNLPPPGSAGTTVPGWDINPYGTSGLSFFSAAPAGSSGYAGNLGVISNLAPGSLVGPASTFITAISTPTALTWNLNSSNNFVGFRFLNEGGGTVHYGYFQLAIGANTLDRTLVSYAFESTPLTAIAVVPEPGTYALMSLGLLAVVAARRRMQKKD